jgi:hypothetical protein
MEDTKEIFYPSRWINNMLKHARAEPCKSICIRNSICEFGHFVFKIPAAKVKFVKWNAEWGKWPARFASGLWGFLVVACLTVNTVYICGFWFERVGDKKNKDRKMNKRIQSSSTSTLCIHLVPPLYVYSCTIVCSNFSNSLFFRPPLPE